MPPNPPIGLLDALNLWDSALEYWDKCFPDGGPPWVKYKFIEEVFEVSLEQKGYRLPPELRVAYRKEDINGPSNQT